MSLLSYLLQFCFWISPFFPASLPKQASKQRKNRSPFHFASLPVHAILQCLLHGRKWIKRPDICQSFVCRPRSLIFQSFRLWEFAAAVLLVASATSLVFLWTCHAWSFHCSCLQAWLFKSAIATSILHCLQHLKSESASWLIQTNKNNQLSFRASCPRIVPHGRRRHPPAAEHPRRRRGAGPAARRAPPRPTTKYHGGRRRREEYYRGVARQLQGTLARAMGIARAIEAAASPAPARRGRAAPPATAPTRHGRRTRARAGRRGTPPSRSKTPPWHDQEKVRVCVQIRLNKKKNLSLSVRFKISLSICFKISITVSHTRLAFWPSSHHFKFF